MSGSLQNFSSCKTVGSRHFARWSGQEIGIASLKGLCILKMLAPGAKLLTLQKIPCWHQRQPQSLRERWHIPGECTFRAEGTEDLDRFIPEEGASLVTPLVKTQPAVQETRLIPGSGGSPGEGTGYPLQYPGLENSMDCVVLGVPKSRTRLSNFHFHPTLTPEALLPVYQPPFAGKNIRTYETKML